MLTIENIQNIEGTEFQMSSGQKYVIGIVRSWYDHYSFGVFPLKENNVASIRDGIIYKLHRSRRNSRGYEMTSANSINPIVYVKPENLTLDNFVLELHIQTSIKVYANNKHI
jgi:hypothetical protein